jgi:16S rRNA G1207 methylase RsmC
MNVVQSVQSDFDVAVVLLPKAKALSRHLIATAQKCTNSGLVIVDGQKDAGIDPILKDLRNAHRLGVRSQRRMVKLHGLQVMWTYRIILTLQNR